jgi:hypothetical protein
MKQFLNTSITSFTIWVAAALINAGLIVVFQILVQPGSPALSQGIPAFFITLALSIPGMFVFWLLYLIQYQRENLFQYLLRWAIGIAGTSAALFQFAAGQIFPASILILVFFAAVSATGALLLHMHKIHSINYKVKTNHHV